MVRNWAQAFATLAIGLVFSGVTLAADQSDIVVAHDVPAKMRDGVILRPDIKRPQADGLYPVLFQRTPFDHRRGVEFGYQAAARGYVAIVQDTRGRYTSDGEFYTFKNESNDGFDTVEWAAALPYSNGKVGMWGGSYVGATQMLTAIAHPPHLAGIAPVVTASNYHDGWTYQGGAFSQWFNQSWGAGLSQDTLNRYVEKSTNARVGQWTLPLADFPLYNFSEVKVGNSLTQAIAPYYLDWLAHPNYDDYWKRWSIEEHFSDINVPALHTVAWYDIFQGGSLRNYIGIKAHGGPAARSGQRMIVTIGGHAGGPRKVGDVDFGPAADELNEDTATLDWYDYLFKGVQNQFATSKPVRIFVMGTNVWRDEDDWPLARAKSTKYFLHSAGKANSLRGDGALSTVAPKAEPNDRYVYDPSNPVPTIGGQLCCDGTHMPPGAKDQRPAESREDVLVYSTPPLAQNTEVTGPVTLELYASSSAVDTDFTAKLVDVGPDGFARNLTEGILRARYRDSQEKPTMLNPGEAYKLNIDLWSTSNVFLKGHMLRLEVSSSNFPRFDRNMNTGEDQATAQKWLPATNLIYHDAAHPSALVLPVVAGQ
jgi:putative CocE/NonD family hydrolase